MTKPSNNDLHEIKRTVFTWRKYTSSSEVKKQKLIDKESDTPA